MAVAPLAITPEREGVVDFTVPFLTAENPNENRRSPKQLTDTFSFLRPLSKEIWVIIYLYLYNF